MAETRQSQKVRNGCLLTPQAWGGGTEPAAPEVLNSQRKASRDMVAAVTKPFPFEDGNVLVADGYWLEVYPKVDPEYNSQEKLPSRYLTQR